MLVMGGGGLVQDGMGPQGARAPSSPMLPNTEAKFHLELSWDLIPSLVEIHFSIPTSLIKGEKKKADQDGCMFQKRNERQYFVWEWEDSSLAHLIANSWPTLWLLWTGRLCALCYALHVCSVLSNALWSPGLLPGSSIHGILQERILEWVAISYSRGSFWSRDRTHVSLVSWIDRWIRYSLSHQGSLSFAF